MSDIITRMNRVKLILYPQTRNVVPVDDIRQFIEELEKAGQLKRIKTEVDTNFRDC